MTRTQSAPALLCLLTFFALTVYFGSSRPASRIGKAYLNPPPELIERFTFGFRESMADSFWLRWIQDGDVCQVFNGASTIVPPVAPADEPKTFLNPRHKVCDDSWSYVMLDAVTKLAPRFKMPYLAGTMTLAILVEDYAGATKIFDRGVENYPTDWQILYRAGYHSLFDTRDLPKAAGLLQRAAENGAPFWVHYLSSRVYTEAGQVELGLATLTNYLKVVDDPQKRGEIEKRIAKLKDRLRPGH